MTNTVYSLNGENFNFPELSSLSSEDLKIGDTIYKGTIAKVKPLELIDHDDILEKMEATAWDIGEEYSENIVWNVTDEAKKELDEMLEAWINKYIVINFFHVESIKELKITQEIFDEIFN